MTKKATTEGQSGAEGGGGNGGTVNVPEVITRDFVRDLMTDNFKLRRRLGRVRDGQSKPDAELQEQVNELTEEVRSLRQVRIPEGHVAVKKEDADALAEYRAINADPKKLAEDVKKKTELETTLAQKERDEKFGNAAKVVGFKPSVLTKLARSENFEIDERDVTEEVDGEKKTKKVPYARKAGDDKAEWVPLEKFAEDNLGEFLPSLREDTKNEGGRAETGREFPRQTSSQQSKAPNSTDVVAGYTGRMYQRPSERNKQKQSSD